MGLFVYLPHKPLIQASISGVCQIVTEWYERFRLSWIKISASSLANSWTVFHKQCISPFSVFWPSRLSQHSCGVTLQGVTSPKHPLTPIAAPTTPPTTWTSLALGGPQECCVCNVTDIFYSCRWSVWVALFETGTQSLLPVNTNLMGLAGWEEL